MAPKFRFYELDVWRKAIDYADVVYELTRRFPDNKRFGLTSQLRRAAVGVSSNIAEGSGRSTDPDFARFVDIAYGSLMETVSQLCVSLRQDFVTREQFDAATALADEVARMLSGLRNRLRA